MFQNINAVQYAWYQTQINTDDKEQFETMRYMSEHTAMFSNPEGVQKVREARENTIAVPDEKFENTIKELFGRNLPNENKISKEDKNNEKINQYLDMKLDDVKFIPFSGE